MAIEFLAEPNPSSEVLNALAATAPANPFWTPAYADARRGLGEEVWYLALHRDGGPAACPAFLRAGRVTKSLDLPSAPDLPGGFWQGLLDWCRARRILRLEVNTFASEGGVPPALTGERARRARTEYVLPLQGSDLTRTFSTNHQRNIKRARKAGLTVRRSRAIEDCRIPADLMQASMDRRRQRGERVPDGQDVALLAALTGSGAAELFQVISEGQVLSSILVLLAARGGYYHSAGTLPDGMKSGASHFLVSEIAAALQADGLTRFNLGGVSERGSGLEQFKQGFGTTRIELEAVECDLTGALTAALTAGARAGMRIGRELWRRVSVGAN